MALPIPPESVSKHFTPWHNTFGLKAFVLSRFSNLFPKSITKYYVIIFKVLPLLCFIHFIFSLTHQICGGFFSLLLVLPKNEPLDLFYFPLLSLLFLHQFQLLPSLFLPNIPWLISLLLFLISKATYPAPLFLVIFSNNDGIGVVTFFI